MSSQKCRSEGKGYVLTTIPPGSDDALCSLVRAFAAVINRTADGANAKAMAVLTDELTSRLTDELTALMMVSLADEVTDIMRTRRNLGATAKMGSEEAAEMTDEMMPVVTCHLAPVLTDRLTSVLTDVLTAQQTAELRGRMMPVLRAELAAGLPSILTAAFRTGRVPQTVPGVPASGTAGDLAGKMARAAVKAFVGKSARQAASGKASAQSTKGKGKAVETPRYEKYRISSEDCLSSNGTKNGNDESQRGLCRVCLCSIACVLFKPCKHLATCRRCLDTMKHAKGTACPVCEVLFEETEEMFII